MHRPPLTRRVFLGTGTAAAASFLFPVTHAVAAPQSVLWDRWLPHDAKAKTVVDHRPWDAFLNQYLRLSTDGINRVAYGAVSSADKSGLTDYLATLGAVNVGRLNRVEQYAFWVNLYNAATVQLVLVNYPIGSILDLDLSPGLLKFGPWDAHLLRVEGEDLTLNDIEHRILRPIWRDPRTHYAVNCAALSCPNLMPLAFTAANTEAQLSDNARAYVNHPRGVAIFPNGWLVLSHIYRWFKADFGRRDRDVIAHLRQHAEPDLAKRLAGYTSVDDHRYDWALNDAATV